VQQKGKARQVRRLYACGGLIGVNKSSCSWVPYLVHHKEVLFFQRLHCWLTNLLVGLLGQERLNLPAAAAAAAAYNGMVWVTYTVLRDPVQPTDTGSRCKPTVSSSCQEEAAAVVVAAAAAAAAAGAHLLCVDVLPPGLLALPRRLGDTHDEFTAYKGRAWCSRA
jgi:hypothetical protein